MSYKNLEIWQLSKELDVEIHKMTLSLPRFEMYLETLFDTESLSDKNLYKSLYSKLETLWKKINRFLQSVQKDHISDK